MDAQSISGINLVVCACTNLRQEEIRMYVCTHIKLERRMQFYILFKDEFLA